jgi:AcrR family transcriptional regulator
VQVSLELGSELGEDGLTMRAIASRLGVSPTALYQYFANKDAILREIRFYGARLLREQLEGALGEPDVVLRLIDFARRYMAFAREQPWLYMVLMEHEEVQWSTLDADEKAVMVGPLMIVRETLAEGRNLARWRDEFDVEKASLHMWAAMHGLCSLMINGRIDERHPMFPVADRDAFVESFVHALVGNFLRS